MIAMASDALRAAISFAEVAGKRMARFRRDKWMTETLVKMMVKDTPAATWVTRGSR
jgi:hypothetical protein